LVNVSAALRRVLLCALPSYPMKDVSVRYSGGAMK
jgi:hypothetical protein